MTQGEAIGVVAAVRGVDGECGSCVKYVCVKLVKAFPEVDWGSALIDALVTKNLWDGRFVDSILREARE